MFDPEFWNGRRVFVTGHTGFKGSWICLLLRELGAQAFCDLHVERDHVVPRGLELARLHVRLVHDLVVWRR